MNPTGLRPSTGKRPSAVSLGPTEPARSGGPTWEDPNARFACTAGMFLRARRADPAPVSAPSLTIDERGLRLVAAAHDAGRGLLALLLHDAGVAPARTSLRFVAASGDVVADVPLPGLAAPSALGFFDAARDDLIVGGDGSLCRFDRQAEALVCEIDAIAAAPLDVAPLQNGAFVYHDGASLYYATLEETLVSNVAAHAGCGGAKPFAPGSLAVGFADTLYLLACDRAATFDEYFAFRGYADIKGRSLATDPCGNLATIDPAARRWRVYDRTAGNPLAGEGDYSGGRDGALAAGGERAFQLTANGNLLLASASGVSYL